MCEYPILWFGALGALLVGCECFFDTRGLWLLGLTTLPEFYRTLPLLFMTTIISWLHDVADHKYVEKDLTLKVRLESHMGKVIDQHRFLFWYLQSKKYVGKPKWMFSVIKRVSWSRQNNHQIDHGKQDWQEKIGTFGILVLEIVQDADRWEAIGKKGIERCRDYTIEKTPSFTNEQVEKKVVEHFEEKLAKIYPQFLNTGTGKRVGKILHEEMVVMMEDMARTMM
jgi:hypothetical protein